MSLVKVGGVCAILSIVAVIVGTGLLLASGAAEADPIEQWLVDLNNGQATVLVGAWVTLLSGGLLIPLAFGLYQALRQAGAVVWLAVAGWVTGLLFVMAGFMLFSVPALELAPAYVEASGATKTALAVAASTLVQTSELAILVGNFFSAGIGALLFALAILRTSVVPRWLGWLGLACALVRGWTAPLEPVSGVFEVIYGIGLLVYLVWTVAMGVALLRLREVPAPAARA